MGLSSQRLLSARPVTPTRAAVVVLAVVVMLHHQFSLAQSVELAYTGKILMTDCMTKITVLFKL